MFLVCKLISIEIHFEFSIYIFYNVKPCNIIDIKKRPVNAVADFFEFKNIDSVTIKSTDKKIIKLLFDQHHTFEDRVIKEQFSF